MTNKDWKKEYYRNTELLLNAFKNGRCTFSHFIDSQIAFTESLLDDKDKEHEEEMKRVKREWQKSYDRIIDLSDNIRRT